MILWDYGMSGLFEQSQVAPSHSLCPSAPLPLRGLSYRLPLPLPLGSNAEGEEWPAAPNGRICNATPHAPLSVAQAHACLLR